MVRWWSGRTLETVGIILTSTDWNYQAGKSSRFPRLREGRAFGTSQGIFWCFKITGQGIGTFLHSISPQGPNLLLPKGRLCKLAHESVGTLSSGPTKTGNAVPLDTMYMDITLRLSGCSGLGAEQRLIFQDR